MEKFAPFIMCVIFIFIAFCLWRLALKISSLAARKKILSYDLASKESTSVLLMSYFGEFAVRPDKWLPVMTRMGKIYSLVDDIIFLPTCIAVVKVKSMSGQVFNGPSRKWTQSVRLRNGEHKEVEFENPIIENERNIIAITKIFEKEKITPPPMYNIVIFASDKVVFSEESPEVYTLSDAVKKLKSLSDGKKIPLKERMAYIRAVKKYSTTKSAARANNKKIASRIK